MSEPTTAAPAEPTITERDMLGALEVLATADPEPDRLLILTDEEIQALDGRSALTLLGSPYLDQDVVDAGSSVAAALRSLAARLLVRTDREGRESEGELVTGSGDPAARPAQLDRRLAGVLTLRRIPEAMVTTQRTLDGGSTTLAHYVFPDSGVLEEYITVDGFHHFAVPALGAVAGRISRFVDPFEVADVDGEPVTVTLQEATAAFDVDDTRSLSVLTAVVDGAGRQATIAATSTAVQVLDNGPIGEGRSPADEVQLSAVSAETLLALIDVLIPRTAEAGSPQS